MRFFSTSDISKNLSLTPEGFLVCKNVPIARTGDQVYYEGEVPVTADHNGAITITRDPDEVFDAMAIASFEGKPVTMHHPEGEVNPENWSELSKGHAQNVRQGDGIEGDVLMADIIIMEKDAIKRVMDREIREISCGYDAEYVETAPGRGKQVNIRGNHIALVDRGRCGSLCAIHDSKTKDFTKGGSEMKGIWKKFVASLTADEQKELKAATADEGLTIDQKVDKLSTTMDKVLKAMKDASEEEEKKKKETEDEEEEEKKKKAAQDARDAEEEEKKKEAESKDCYGKSKDAAPVLQDILYRSSILAPELHPLTADSIKSKKTFDETCCFHKRKALDASFKTEDGKAAILPFLAGKTSVDFFTADCAVCDMAFIGASEIMKQKSTQDRVSHKVSDFFKGGISVKDINAANDKFWNDKKGGK